MFKLNQKGLIQLLPLLLILAGIFAGVYLVQKSGYQIFKPKALYSNPDKLTQELVKSNERYVTLNEEEKNEQLPQMIFLAKQRKQELLKELIQDPDVFISHATLVDQRDNFPEAVQEYIERKADISGEVQVAIAEDFKQKPDLKYTLEDDQLYQIHFEEDPEIETGFRMAISGTTLDSNLVPQETNILEREPTRQPTLPNIKIGAVIIKFKNAFPTAFSEQEVGNLLFGSTNSVVDYFRISTYDQIAISGDVFETIEIEETSSVCNPDAWANNARKQSQSRGIDIHQYYSLFYILTPRVNCPWVGLANFGRGLRPSNIWVNHNLNLSTFVHELGHNLNLSHSNFLSCREVDPEGYSCQSVEYGDHFTPMGNDLIHNFDLSAPHKYALGLLPNVVEIDIDTLTKEPLTLNIAPLEEVPPVGLASAVKIFNNKLKEYYYLEYRQPLGVDALFPKSVTHGIIIRRWSGDYKSPTLLINPRSEDNIYSANLVDGEVFYDSLGDMSIKQVSHNSEQVVVQVVKGYLATEETEVIGQPDTPIPENQISDSQPFCTELRINDRSKGTLISGTTTRISLRKNLLLVASITDDNGGRNNIKWLSNGGAFLNYGWDYIYWRSPNKPGEYRVTLQVDEVDQPDCVAKFKVE